MVLPKFLPRSSEDRRAEAYRSLLRREAKMGGALFGPIPEGHRREFFCLDTHTWVWHEEWVDTQNTLQSVTTRYDVRPHGILKSQGTNAYQLVKGEELRNFYRAARMFRDNVHAEYLELQRQV